MDCAAQGILQARTLEWVAFPFSSRSSPPRDQTQVSRIAGGFFTSWATREAQEYWSGWLFPSPADLPHPGIKPRSPALLADSLPAEPQRKPKNTGVGSLSLLQQIFPTEESNWGLLHCRRILYQLSYERRSQGSCSAPKLTSEGKGQHLPRVLDSSTWILPPLTALSCGSASWNLAHFCSSSGPLGTQSRLDQPVMLSTLGQLPSWPPTSLPISSLTEKCFSAQARSMTRRLFQPNKC